MTDDDGWALSWERRPRLRGWIHAGAAATTVPITVLAARRAPKGAARVGVAVFGASYATMLTASAAYHRLPRSAAQARWFRRVDHAAIFGAIAGTWTPVAIVTLPAPAAAAVIAGVWSTAAAGAATKLTTLEGTHDHARWAYLVLGWASVGLIPFVWKRGGWAPLANLVAGGISYSAGAALLGSNRWPNAEWFGHHEAWHVAVLGGGAFHAVAVGQLIGAPIPGSVSPTGTGGRGLVRLGRPSSSRSARSARSARSSRSARSPRRTRRSRRG